MASSFSSNSSHPDVGARLKLVCNGVNARAQQLQILVHVYSGTQERFAVSQEHLLTYLTLHVVMLFNLVLRSLSATSKSQPGSKTGTGGSETTIEAQWRRDCLEHCLESLIKQSNMAVEQHALDANVTSRGSLFPESTTI